MTQEIIIQKAFSMGFSNAAIVPTEKLTFVPAYRAFCEENLCGKYNLHPACPPTCGTVDEMIQKARKYQNALVLQMMPDCSPMDSQGNKEAKRNQNIITEELLNFMKEDGIPDALIMSAGPYKKYSCMSAYCLDAQKTADLAGMECWVDDGLVRMFSLILF